MGAASPVSQVVQRAAATSAIGFATPAHPAASGAGVQGGVASGPRTPYGSPAYLKRMRAAIDKLRIDDGRVTISALVTAMGDTEEHVLAALDALRAEDALGQPARPSQPLP